MFVTILRTLRRHVRLALTAIALLGLTALAGATPGHARPPARGAAQPHVAATATVIHAFNPNTEGYQPDYSLVQGPDGSLVRRHTQWRLATATADGSVFKVAPDGTQFTVLHTFHERQRRRLQPEAKLLLVGNLLFGTCQTGGRATTSGRHGVRHQSHPGQSPPTTWPGIAVLHYFRQHVRHVRQRRLGNSSPTPPDGASPEGSLCLGVRRQHLRDD